MKISAKKDNIINARIEKGLTGADIAREIGVTKTAYYNIEKNRNGASPKNAKKISVLLGVEVEEIFRIEGDG